MEQVHTLGWGIVNVYSTSGHTWNTYLDRVIAYGLTSEPTRVSLSLQYFGQLSAGFSVLCADWETVDV